MMDNIANMSIGLMDVNIKVSKLELEILITKFRLPIFSASSSALGNWAVQCVFFLSVCWIKIKWLQWSYGGLDIGTILALIEASTPEGDDQKMQTGVSALDTCSQISLFFLSWNGKIKTNFGKLRGNGRVRHGRPSYGMRQKCVSRNVW